MRTVGEILKKARLEKRVSLEDAEKHLRIRKKFLIALEQNTWAALPSLPYIKGFLRSYSEFLGLKPDEMIAVFRRQYSGQASNTVLPSGVADPLNRPRFSITPRLIMIGLATFCVTLIFGYLFFQFQTSMNPPFLEISKPVEGSTVPDLAISIEGKTDPDAVLSINNRKIALTDTGGFSAQIELSPGLNTIVIEATSKFGKKRMITRSVLQEDLRGTE